VSTGTRNRVLAAIGAVALVVVALVVRGALVDDDAGSGGTPRRAVPVVGCAADLQAICQALATAGVIAEDPPTFDLASDGAERGVVQVSEDGESREVTVDGWITWDGTYDVDRAEGTPAVWADPLVVGSAPLDVGVRSGTAPEGCPPRGITWACLVDAAVDGGLKVGLGRPSGAQGLARLLGVASALAAEVDGDVNRIDRTRLDKVLEGGTTGPAKLDRQRTLFHQRGTYDVLVAPHPWFASSTGTIGGATVQAVADPSLPMTVVVVRHGDVDLDRVAAEIRTGPGADALRAAAWVQPGDGDPFPPETADDLYALREVASS